MNNSPNILDQKSMTFKQVLVVILAIGLNALDGIDILSISFAAPGIAAEWGIDRAALGIVLSMELIGMCVGSIFLGGLADSIGRRKSVLICLFLMTIGMFMVTRVSGIAELSIWRVLTGIGIGGMLAAVTAIASEFSNAKNRTVALSFVVIGYPIGGIIGGIFIVPLLKIYDWRSVFYLGCFATLLFIPLVYFWIPESVSWLIKKNPQNALEKVNQTLKNLGHQPVNELPQVNQDNKKLSVFDIFQKSLIATTIIVTIAYLFHITTFYFILKWVPKIVVDMGFVASSAAFVLTWANVGGALGGALFGIAALRFKLKPLTISILLCSIVALVIFGQSPANLTTLTCLAVMAGMFTNAGVVGLYSIFAYAFPTHVRAFGTGFAIGVGRGGAVISPMIAGFLFNANFSLATVASVMAMGSLLAAAALLFLKLPAKADQN